MPSLWSLWTSCCWVPCESISKQASCSLHIFHCGVCCLWSSWDRPCHLPRYQWPWEDWCCHAWPRSFRLPLRIWSFQEIRWTPSQHWISLGAPGICSLLSEVPLWRGCWILVSVDVQNPRFLGWGTWDHSMLLDSWRHSYVDWPPYNGSSPHLLGLCGEEHPIRSFWLATCHHWDPWWIPSSTHHGLWFGFACPTASFWICCSRWWATWRCSIGFRAVWPGGEGVLPQLRGTQPCWEERGRARIKTSQTTSTTNMWSWIDRRFQLLPCLLDQRATCPIGGATGTMGSVLWRCSNFSCRFFSRYGDTVLWLEHGVEFWPSWASSRTTSWGPFSTYLRAMVSDAKSERPVWRPTTRTSFSSTVAPPSASEVLPRCLLDTGQWRKTCPSGAATVCPFMEDCCFETITWP